MRKRVEAEHAVSPIQDLEAVEKHNPSEPSTHFLLAQAYRATAQTQEASRELKTFIQLARQATAANAQAVIKESQSTAK